MHKLSYKTLFTIFFFLLIGVVILSRFVLPNKKVSASWWNETWSYRKAISVTNSTGSNQTNAQIKILNNYDLSALVTASKLQSDLDDLRFTDINGNLISYWIEDSTNNSVDVWGLLSTIPSSGTTILMYYGNSSANSVSNNSWMADIGGTISSFNGYRIHAFTTNGTYYNYLDRNVEIIVVAGGGGGAYRHGAGGGAGGLIYGESFSVTNNVSVTVGNGGSGAVTSGPIPYDGSNSIFDSLTAIGGGRAGGWDSTSIGGTGGSGGGSCSVDNVAGTSGQGNSGGNGYVFGSPYNWGGGGGAGGTGYNGTSDSNGNGGVGLYYGDKFGNSYGENGWFAGGGGGGGHAPAATYQGLGGNGGGGDGGTPGSDSPGQDGLANTGGGGGGPTSPGGGSGKGGNGGSGIVLIRYQSSVNTPSNISSNSPSAEELSPAPIAYWKFDEGVGTTIYDSTSNQKNGIFAAGTSSPTWVNEDQCISGKCLLFDGSNNQSISLANEIFSNSKIRTQGVTVQAWVKLTNNNTEMRVVGQVISNGYSDTSSGGIGIRSTNKASFIAYDDAGAYKYVDSNTTLQTNRWYFISGTFNPTDSKMNIYIDGKLDSSSTVTCTTFSRLSNNDYNRIGAIYNNGSSRAFYGYIDEVKIYPYARTADQIKQDYNSRGSTKGSSVNLGIKSNTAPSLKSKLVAHYKFDENNGTTVYDSTGNNNTGILTGVGWVDGKYGIGTSFGGTNNVVLISDTNNSLDLANDFTISFWVNPTSSGTKELIGKPAGGNYEIWQSNTDLSVRINGFSPIINASSIFTYGQWTHITVKYERSVGLVTIFKNGTYFTGGNNTNAAIINNSALQIGAYSDGTSYPFQGKIDEVKIYNTALTAEEIKQDYNQNSAIQFGSTNQTIGGTTTSLEYCIPGDTSHCASPIAEWKMDEGVGTSVIDTSGNGKNLTTYNNPTWTQGKIGGSINLNGTTQYAKITDSSFNRSNGQEISISSWIYPKRLGGQYQDIIGNRDEMLTFNWLLYQHTTDGSIQLHGASQNKSTYIPALNQWTYIEATVDSSGNYKLYANGQLVQSLTGFQYWSGSPTELHIGNYGSNGEPYQGIIDHVKIYNYARTPAQVAYDYNKGGPIGWWKFDECQGNIAYDWSGIGNTGSINIGPSGSQNSLGTCQVGTSAAWTNGTTGKINSSLNFDGTDDKVNAGNGTSLRIPDELTVSAWVKPTIVNDWKRVVSKGDYDTEWIFGISNSGKADFTATDIDNNLHTVYGTTTMTAGVWQHITATYSKSAGFIKIYLNGNIDRAPYPITTSIKNSGQPVLIGSDTYPRWFNGQIDDVRIYNYALTSEQVKTLYNGGAVNFR